MGTDSSNNLYAQKGQALQIMHVPTGQIVEFKAFLTDFDDKYASNWTSDAVYGRMDPIATFQGTTREISVAWTVPAFSNAEAIFNLSKASLLFRMLYPVYENSQFSGAGQISAAPLLKIKFANLICSMTNGSGTGGVEKAGLLGYVDGFSLKPDLENQFHDPGYGLLYPMSFALSCTFKVMHTHKLGWSSAKDGNVWSTSNPRHPDPNSLTTPQFPYGSLTPPKSSALINNLGINDAINRQDPDSVQGVQNPNEPGAIVRPGDRSSGQLDPDGRPIPNSAESPNSSGGSGVIRAAEENKVLQSA